MLNSQSWESTPVVINSFLSGLMCHPSPKSSILKIPSQICSLGSSWHVLARFCDSFSKQSLFSHSRPGCDVILLMISETGRGGGNTSRWRSVSPWKSPAQGGSLHGLQTREGCYFQQGAGATSPSSGCSGGPGVQDLHAPPLNVPIAGLKVSIIAYQGSNFIVEGYELSLLGDTILFLNILILPLYFIFDSTGSLLQCVGFSYVWLLLLQSTGYWCFSTCDMQAQ